MAATIVDQLLVTLELDSAKFTAAIEKVKVQLGELSKAAKDMPLGGAMKTAGDEGDAAGTKIKGGMGRGMMGVMMLVAAVYKLNTAFGLPALKRMTQEVVDSETKTLRLSNYLQLNARELQAWQKTVQIHGGDIGGFNSGIEKMSANLGKLGSNVRGAKILQQYLGLAGVTDAMVKGKDALAVLKLYSEQMQSMDPGRQVLVGRKLGLDDNTIRTLQDGGPLLAEHLQNMRSLAATNAELWNAREVARAQAEANLQWERAKEVVGAAFLPVLLKLSASLKEASQWIRAHQDVVKKAAVFIGAALTGLALVAGAAAVAIMVAGLKIAFGMTLATGGLWAVGAAAGVLALGAIAVAAGNAAGLFDTLKDAHSGAVDEILAGDQKLAVAAKAGQVYSQWVKEAREELEKLKKIQGETAQAIVKENERAQQRGYSAFGAAPPVEPADTAKLAGLTSKAAALQARYAEIERRLGVGSSVWASAGLAAWNRDPKEATRIVTGVNAAEAKASQLKVEHIDIHVNTSRGEQFATEFVDMVHGRSLQAAGGTH
jgi:hypothetical protein